MDRPEGLTLSRRQGVGPLAGPSLRSALGTNDRAFRGAPSAGFSASQEAVAGRPRPTTRRISVAEAEAQPVGYLPGIDGLRAISVIAVLLYHAGMSWLPGGFLGVEVFFVISGYLITLLLLTEHAATRTISLKQFWLRRARRLLPALYVLLAAVALLLATVDRAQAEAVRGQIVAALTYCTNWYFVAVGEPYFGGAGRPSPLQHLWSLAIEEQFYLVWPGLLWILMRTFKRRIMPIAAVIVAGILASTLLMGLMYQPAQDPSRVYYGTDTRAAALLVGALLALLWRPALLSRNRGTRRSPAVDCAGAIGVVGLAVVFATVHEYDTPLYRGGFLLVSFLSVLAIAAGSHPASAFGRRVLGHPVMAWIGRRSYGLYLWHWPVFVFTRPGADWALGTYGALVPRLALTALLTELSYRFVETPVRNGAIRHWVEGLWIPRARHSLRRSFGRRSRPAAVGLALVLFVVPVGARLATAEKHVDPAQQAVESGGDPAAQPPLTISAPDDAVGSPSKITPTPEDHTVTVLGDSVIHGIRNMLATDLAGFGWDVDFRGKPAIMLKQMRAELEQSRKPVGSLVVIGLGYNSLWERNRKNYDSWAKLWDRDAEALLDTLKQLGAKRFVWITLREPSLDVIPPKERWQYDKYAWFYPYTNEQVRELDAAREDLVVADWAAVSNKPGITYDAVHLTTEGAYLMIGTIRDAARI